MNGMQTHARGYKSRGGGSMYYLIIVRRGREEKDLLHVERRNSLSCSAVIICPMPKLLVLAFFLD